MLSPSVAVLVLKLRIDFQKKSSLNRAAYTLKIRIKDIYICIILYSVHAKVNFYMFIAYAGPH